MDEELKRFWDEQKDAFIIPYNDMIKLLRKEYENGFEDGRIDMRYEICVLNCDE